MLNKFRCWLNGWRLDLDGWWVRARRTSDPASLQSHIGFLEESAIAVRTLEFAAIIDAGRKLPLPVVPDFSDE